MHSLPTKGVPWSQPYTYDYLGKNTLEWFFIAFPNICSAAPIMENGFNLQSPVLPLWTHLTLLPSFKTLLTWVALATHWHHSSLCHKCIHFIMLTGSLLLIFLINRRPINNIRHDDNTVLIANTLEDLQTIIDKIVMISTEYGLSRNIQIKKC